LGEIPALVAEQVVTSVVSFTSPHVVGLRGIPISDFPTLKDNEVYVFRNYGTPRTKQ